MKQLILVGNQKVKFQDTETTISLTLVSDGNTVTIDSTKTYSVKIKNGTGYVKAITATPDTDNNMVTFSTAGFDGLPVDAYFIELWVLDTKGQTIYPSDSFIELDITANATGVQGQVVPAITLQEFEDRFGTLQSDLEAKVSTLIGPTGATGNGISGVSIQYQLGADGNTIPTGTWSDTPSTPTDNLHYMWTRNVTTYTDGSTHTSYNISAKGTKGNNFTIQGSAKTISGLPSKGIDGEGYMVGTELYVWTNGKWNDIVSMKGDKGDQGIQGIQGLTGNGISGVSTQYQLGTNGATIPTGTWNNTPSTPTDSLPYMWTRNVTTYTDKSTSTSYNISAKGTKGNNFTIQGSTSSVAGLPRTGTDGEGYMVGTELYVWTNGKWNDIVNMKGVQGDRGIQGIQGIKGDTGNGIKSTSTDYQLSAQGVEVPNTGWSTTIPVTTNALPYLWTRVTITFTDGSQHVIYFTSNKGDKGDKGDTGEKGDTGANLAVKGALDKSTSLPSTGNSEGDAYLVGTDLYVYTNNAWKNCGPIVAENTVLYNADGSLNVNGTNFNYVQDLRNGKIQYNDGTKNVQVTPMDADKEASDILSARNYTDSSVSALSTSVDTKLSSKANTSDLSTGLATKADDSKVVHTFDMRKPASDVAGIDEVSTLQTQVDSSAVGINLAFGTDQEYTMGYGIPNTVWQDGYAYEKLPTTIQNGEILPQDSHTFSYTLTKGITYTQTVWFETDAKLINGSGVQFTWYTSVEHDPQPATLVNLDENKYKVYSTYTWPGKSDNSLRVFDIEALNSAFDLSTGTYLKFGKLKLEKGSLSTDWCPNPDDKVNVFDMRKPASDVAGIEEVNAKQDKLTIAPADDSKVVHLSGANNFDTVPTVNNNPLLLASSLPSTLADTTKLSNFTAGLQSKGTPVATSTDLSTGLATKADDSKVVHTADMRKPASDVAGIEEVNSKQDKIGYTPADDSKVVHISDMRKPASDVAGIEEVNAKQDKIGYTPADDSKVVHTADTSNWQKSKITSDSGDVLKGLLLANNDDLNAYLTGLSTGITTFYVQSGVANNPSTQSARGLFHCTGDSVGVGYLIDNNGNQWSIFRPNRASIIYTQLETTGIESKVVHNTGNEEIAGQKTFDVAPIDKTTGKPYITKDGVPAVPSTLADTTKDANFTGKLQKSGIDVATTTDVSTAVNGATSQVAHLVGTNNFNTVPTVNNHPLLLASSLPSDLARTSQQTNFTAGLQSGGLDVATAADLNNYYHANANDGEALSAAKSAKVPGIFWFEEV